MRHFFQSYLVGKKTHIPNPCRLPGTDEDFGGLLSASLILLRNRLLDNLLRLLFTTKEKCTVNAQ